MRNLVQQVNEESDKRQAKKLSNSLVNLTTENAVLKIENKGFKEALYYEKKRRKRGKQLFEEFRA